METPVSVRGTVTAPLWEWFTWLWPFWPSGPKQEWEISITHVPRQPMVHWVIKLGGKRMFDNYSSLPHVQAQNPTQRDILSAVLRDMQSVGGGASCKHVLIVFCRQELKKLVSN